jgi:hypothetical protein
MVNKCELVSTALNFHEGRFNGIRITEMIKLYFKATIATKCEAE